MNEIESYKKLHGILNSLKPYSIDLTLERITLFLEKCGNPQNSFKSIIVGGTNGKGSVCQFLTDVFMDANVKVGTYTSPHLIQINERFKINNKTVSYKTLLESAEKLQGFNNSNLTYFEFLTAMAFDIFKQNGVEMAVLEVGMGGEFDATNTVDSIASIITSISKDHTEYLGQTYEKIAKTKSKIVKNVGIIGKNNKRVIDTIKENTQAKLFFVDKNHIKKASSIKSLMKGESVKENLATAILAIDVLNELYGFNLKYDALKNSFWPGRFEIIKTADKTFIFDGAHNKNATLKLANSLKDYQEKLLLFSALKSKSWQDNLNILLPLFKKIILAPIAEHKLAENIKNIKKFAKKKEIIVFQNVNEAILYSLSCKEKTVVIAGSLYLIGEAKACNIYKNFMP